MALELQIKKLTTNSDGSFITIGDSTVAYDATTNPKGYGTPNDDRNVLALFLLANSKRYNGAKTISDTPLEIASYDPVTISTWTVLMQKAGWVEATVYGIPFYDDTVPYQIGECVWVNTFQEIRRIKTKSGGGPYVYTYDSITIPELEDLESITKYKSILNTNIIITLCSCLGKAKKKALLDHLPADMATVDELDLYYYGINSSFASNAYAESQSKVEKLENLCECFTDNCNC
jgi:hypothetical protein